MISAGGDIVCFFCTVFSPTSRKSCGLILSFILLLSTAPLLNGQTGPGGVGSSSSNLLWLKADAGTSSTVDGAALSSWSDQSGNGLNATQAVANRQPKYVAVSSSGRPSIWLNNAADGVYDYFGVASGFSDFSAGLSAFVVVKPNASNSYGNFFNFGGGAPNLYNEAICFSRYDVNLPMWYQVVANGSDSYTTGGSLTNGSFQILGVRQDPGAYPGSSGVRLYKNGNMVAGPLSVNVPRNFVRTDNYIGHDSWGVGSLDAEFGEIIIYNYLVNNAQRIIITNYLSSKYNIPITLTSDKYSFDATFGSDVAGIGRYDATNSHTSATSAGILNISNASSLDAGDYMLYGHNGGSVTSWSSAGVPADALNLSYERVARVWRVDKSNDAGTVTITGDYSALPPPSAGYTARILLVDADGDFTSGAVAYALRDMGSNKYNVTGVALNDGDYLTFVTARISNDDPCSALSLTVGAACNFQVYSNEGATGSSVADPGNCDGTGSSGYSGSDVWFQVTVPSAGSILINTDTQSSSPSNLEWAHRVGIAVYSGTCASLTKVNCQISPVSQVPPGDVSLNISGRTPGETLFIRMWEYGNNDDGKFYICVSDPCLSPPVITGSIPPSVLEGCNAASAPAAATTVAQLEALGLSIADGCTPDASLVVTHSDTPSGTCPIVLTRRYTVTDASSSSATYDQTISIDDTQGPVTAGALSVVNIAGCNIGSVPAAVNTVAALEALPGNLTVTDGCTPDGSVTVTNTDAVTGTCPISITRTYTLTDACGNTSTVSQTINIDDTQSPVITGSLNPVTAEGCSATAAPPAATTIAELEALPGTVSITDNCTPKASIVVSYSDTPSGTCPVTISRTYTVTDACGNFTTLVQSLTIADSQAPVIAGAPDASNIEGCGAASAPAALTTVAALEALPGAVSISDGCTADASLAVSSSDLVTGSCPTVVQRTYTITDACGNSATLVHIINIDDNTAPLVSGTLSPLTVEGCGAADAPAAVTTVAALEALAGAPAISDACTPDASLVVTSSDNTTGTCPAVLTRTYTITDACGNHSELIQVITINDSQAPAVSGSMPVLSLEGCMVSDAPAAATTVAELEAMGGVTIADNCTPDNLVTVSSTEGVAGTCPVVLTRTYKITDGCGNNVSFSQTINIDDNQAPVITGSISPTMAEGCDASAIPAAATTVTALEALPGGVSISDLCTPKASISVTHSDSQSGSCPLTIIRTYTLTDACGNTSTLNHTITVDDTQAPVVTGFLSVLNIEGCDAAAAPVPASSVAGLQALPGAITVDDACTSDAALTVTSSDLSSGTCPLLITRTYTITDACGNQISINQAINIDDNTPPLITGSLTPVVLEGCDAGAVPPAVNTAAALEALTGNLSISDGCTADAALTVTHSDVVTGTCPVTIARTYTITDGCGSSSTVTQNFTVRDTEPPVLTGSLPLLDLEGCTVGSAPAPATSVADLVSLGGITIVDACTPDALISVTSTDGVTGTCPIVVSRTYRIADACGNYVNFSQTINIDDTQPPVITGTPDPLTVEGCGAASAPAAVATVAALEALPGGIDISDLCTADGALTVSSSDVVSGTCPIVVTRTYTITDACGNQATVVHSISIEDTTPPAITGTLAPLSVEGCDLAAAPAAVTTVAGLEALAGGIDVSDNCTADAALTLTHSDSSNGDCPIVLTRHYTITDACGSQVSIDQVINIDDTQPPVVTGSLSPVVLEACSAADIPAAVGSVAELVALAGDVNISDGCTANSSLLVTNSDNVSGSCPTVMTRIYAITDACGNSTNISQLFTVDDTQAPVVTGALAPVSLEGCTLAELPAAAASAAELEALGGITITDACTPDALLLVTSTDGVTGTCPIIVSRTYQITDGCGNSVSLSQTISIDDTQPPAVTGAPDPLTVEGCSASSAPAAAETVAELEALPGTLAISDICTADGPMTVTHSDAVAGSCPIVVTRTYTVSDACGNPTSFQQLINIEDNTPPVVSGSLSPVTVEGCLIGDQPAAAVTIAELEALPGTPDISDACSPDGSLTLSHTDSATGTCPIVVTRTYTITDACGNSSVLVQIINIDDETAPSFSAPPAITIYKDASCGYDASPGVTGDVSDETDNCTAVLDAVFTDIVADGPCEGRQVITRTWSLSDACSNTVTHDQLITVLDNTAPTFTVPPDITISSAAACSYDASVTVTGDVTDEADNCDTGLDATFSDLIADGTCEGNKVISRTWSLTDDCGNTTTHLQTITVADNTAPVFTAPADAWICRAADCTYDASPALTGDVTDETDNCSTGLSATWSDDATGAADCDKAGIILRTWTLTDKCGNVAASQVQTIRVNPLPSVSITPADPLLCHTGESTAFAVTTTNTLPVGSTWKYNVSAAYPSGVSGSLGVGLTDQTAAAVSDVLTNTTNVVQTVSYTFTPKISSGGTAAECGSGLPQTVTVDIDPQPKISVTSDPVYCHDGNPVFSISTVNTSLHAGSLWRYDVSVVYPAGVTGSWAGGLSNQSSPGLTDDLTNSSAVVQTVSYTFTPHISPGDGGSECGNGIPQTITVDIEPQPQISVATDPLLCHDGDAVFSISTNNTDLHPGSTWMYDVAVSYPAGVTGSLAGGLTNQTALTLTDDLQNNTGIVQSVSYTFTPHIDQGAGGGDCGGGVPVTVTVDLDPKPIITVTTDQLICHDGPAVFNISTVNNTLYPGSTWRYDVSVTYPAGVTGSWASGLADQTALVLTDNLASTAAGVQTVSYTFTPHIQPGDGGAECGNGVPFTITVDVDPQPLILVNTDPVLCHDGNATFTIATGNSSLHPGDVWRYDVSVTYPAGVTGSWAGGLADQTAASLADAVSNTTGTVQTISYTFTPHIFPGDGGAECTGGTPVTVTADVDPQPAISVTTDPLLCHDGDAVFSIGTANDPLHAGSVWRYDVTVSYPAGVTGSWSTGLTDQTATTLTDDLTSTSDIVQTVTYTFTPHIQPGDGGSECENGVPLTISTDIEPRPKITVSTDPLVCHDGDATFIISTVNSTLHAGSVWRYDVSVNYPAGVTGSWAGGLSDQTALSLTDDLTSTADVVQTVTYTFTPHISPGDGGGECGNGVPLVVTVDVDPRPSITVSADPLICHDGSITLTTGTLNTLLHQGSVWRYDVSVIYPAGVTGDLGGGLSDQTAASITDNLTNSTDVVQTVSYTFTPHIRPGDGGAECGNGLPVTVTTDLDPQPKITVSTDPLLCYDGAAVFSISTVNTALHAGSTWRYDVSASYPAGVTGSWTGGLSDQTALSLTDNLTNNTDVVQTVSYTFTPHIRPGDGGGECGNGVPFTLTVDLDPRPKITVSADQLLCHDGDAVFSISTVNSALHSGSQWRYDVSAVYPAGVTGSWAGGLTDQTAAALTDDLTNNTDVVQTVSYTFTPHIMPGDGGSECGNGQAVVITVDLDPRPRITVSTDQLLCHDGDASFSISTVNTTLHTGSVWNYDVSVIYPAGVTGSWSAGLTGQTATALTDNLTNNSDVVQTVSYTFTPHIRPGDGGSECGNGVPFTITVDLDPRPKITVSTDPLICYDGDAVFNISTVNTTLHGGSTWRYDVSVSYPAGVTGSWAGGLSNQTAATLTDDLTNNSDVVQTVNYTFTPHILPGDGGNECSNGVPFTISVDLDPRPKISVTSDPLLCYDGNAVFNISTVNTSLHTGSAWRYDVSVSYPAGVTGSWAGGLTDQTLPSLTDDLTNNTDVVQTVTYTFTPHIRPGDGGTECGNGVPFTITVDLDPRPKISVTTDPLVCYDGDAVFSISTVNSSLHTGSEWRYDVSVVYPAGVTGSWASGLLNQTSSSLTDDLTNNTDVVQTVTYTFTPHIKPGDGGSECGGGLPFTITVDLDPRPKITVSTDQLLCYDGDAVFSISTVNTTLHSGSSWRYDVSVSYPAGVTGSWAGGLTDQAAATLTDDLTNNTDIVQTVTYVFTPHIRPGDGGPECGNGAGFTITVDLDPRPKITVTNPPVLCFDGDAAFSISTVNTLLHQGSLWRYDISVTYPAGVTGSWATGLTNQTAGSLTDNLTNTSDVVQTVVYTFTPHIKPGDNGSECLNGLEMIVNVVIDPQPRLFPVPPDVIQCDSIVTNIVLQSPNIFSSGFITFNETVSGDGSITGYPTGQVTGLPDDHTITDRLVNQTDAYHTVVYTLVPVSPTGCANGSPVAVSVTVNPTPRVIALNSNAMRDSSICYGGTTHVVLTSPTVMTSGSILFDYNVTLTGGAAISGNTAPASNLAQGYTISYPYQNDSDTLHSVLYNITPRVDNAICPAGPVVSSRVKVHAQPLQDLLIVTPLTCEGGSDASLRAVPSRGAGNYYFDWVRTSTDQVHGYGITDLVNRKGGRWDVKVTDNLGCKASDFIFVEGAYLDSYLYVVDTTGYGTTCPGSNDGQIWVKENNSSTGIPPFEYWVVRNDVDTVIHSTLAGKEIVQKWFDQEPGRYKLILRDANGCYNLNYPEAVITEPDPIELSLASTSYPGGFNVSCKGYNDGSVWMSSAATGGNGSYQYHWFTYDGVISGPDNLDRLDNITAGIYYLQTSDRKGCMRLDSIKLTEPDGMTLSGSSVHTATDGVFNISCNGGSDGSIGLTITGGSGNYTYSWTGPGTYTAVTRDISGLAAGLYTCIVRDVNGCILMPVPQFELTEPPALTVSAVLSDSPDHGHNITCFGGTGSADITVGGGIAGTYQYSWTSGDGSGIVAGQEDQPALTAGTYHLKISDQNQCEISTDITLTQPEELKLSFNISGITCQAPLNDNGAIDLTISGGMTPYTQLWSNGSVTEDLSGLTEGYYRVTVTDANGCSRTDSVLISLPAPITYDKTISDYNGWEISCNGLSNGFIWIDPTSGEEPYTYSWTGPAGFTAGTKNISGLSAGAYTLTITDRNFCTATEVFTMEEPEKLGIGLTLSASNGGAYNLNCAGVPTGTIDVVPVNASGAVSYLWSDGDRTQNRSGLAAGKYGLVITDGNGCPADTTVTLTQPDSLKVSYQATKPFCTDMPDGSIALTVSGGITEAPYQYEWSDNSTTSTLTAVPAGRYTVTVSDIDGCAVTLTIKLEPENDICLLIPNAISPNGDLINDYWNIGLIDLYPGAEVSIYNRWGEQVWRSARGYPDPWDGTSEGRRLPMDSYHYVIDLHNGTKLIIGSITIVR